MNIASTPKPPYYAVIFTSLRTRDGGEEYEATAERMLELAVQQEGFLGVESAREEAGITVSYWASLAAIQTWKRHAEHLGAQRLGRTAWYSGYRVRIAKVEREYGFSRK